MNSKIRQIVKDLKQKYHTSSPDKLIAELGIFYFEHPLGNLLGCYKMLKKTKCVFVNSDIESESIHKIVCAHELGHAMLHPKIDSSYIGNYTLYSNSKIEIEANTFAAELLLPDEVLIEYQGMTVDQIAAYLNVIPELVKLKFL